MKRIYFLILLTLCALTSVFSQSNRFSSIYLTTKPAFADTSAQLLVRRHSDGQLVIRHASSLGTTYTASNGATLVGNDFQLGGLATSDIAVNGNNLYTISLGSAGITDNLARGFVGVTPGSAFISAYLDNTGTSPVPQISVDPSAISISPDANAGLTVTLNANSTTNKFVLTDNKATPTGIEYAGTGYVTQTHSLADKEYADTKQPLDADLTAIAALSTDGFLKKTSGTWGMDNSTYLSGTMVSTRIPIGSTSSSLTTNADLTYASNTLTTRSIQMGNSGIATTGYLLSAVNSTNDAAITIDPQGALNMDPSRFVLSGVSNNNAVDKIFGQVTGNGELYYRDLSSIVTQNITNGTTGSAPSEDKVYDALALKADASSIPTLTSGTYTPSVTGVLNYNTSSPSTTSYLRVGNTVTVGLDITVTPTAAGLITFDVTIPISSNLTGGNSATGTGVIATNFDDVFIDSNGAGKLRCSYIATDNSARIMKATAIYTIN